MTPPKDYEKWAALIRTLILHFTERYGVDEVKTWYFEVWNEPNLSPGFWTGTQEDYFKLYQYTARAVKSVNREYRVSMGKPAQLTRQQVEQTKKQNDGAPVSREIITIKATTPFFKELDLRENDVFFLNLMKL